MKKKKTLNEKVCIYVYCMKEQWQQEHFFLCMILGMGCC